MIGNKTNLIECDWNKLVAGQVYYYFRSRHNLRRFRFTGEYIGFGMLRATDVVNVFPDTLQVNHTDQDFRPEATIMKKQVYKSKRNLLDIQEEQKFLSLFE